MNNIHKIQRVVADALQDAGDSSTAEPKITDVLASGRDLNEVFFWTDNCTKRYRVRIEQVDIYGIPV